MRWVRAMEQILGIIPDETTSLEIAVEEVRFEAGLAAARAQQALDVAEKDYGMFFDTTDQVAALIDTPTEATFNNTQVAKGITISGSQISVVKTGLYEIEFRIQL